MDGDGSYHWSDEPYDIQEQHRQSIIKGGNKSPTAGEREMGLSGESTFAEMLKPWMGGGENW